MNNTIWGILVMTFRVVNYVEPASFYKVKESVEEKRSIFKVNEKVYWTCSCANMQLLHISTLKQNYSEAGHEMHILSATVWDSTVSSLTIHNAHYHIKAISSK